MRDLYAVLHVHSSADREAIRASFRGLARQFHPDFGGNAQQMQAISEAWAILGRPDRRVAYDGYCASARLARQQARPATTTQDRAGTRDHPATQEHALTQTRSPDTLDYGRYQGWTIEEMAYEDPDYLEWLRRSPGGRSFRSRIDAALANKAARMPPPPPPPERAKRRSRFRH